MPDASFIALIVGSGVIAVFAVLANTLELRAFDKKYGVRRDEKAKKGT